MKKLRIKASISGGRTSAYMAVKLKEFEAQCPGLYEIEYVFCNTSREDDRTLAFVDQLDKYLGLNLKWLEAVVHPGDGVGTTHRIVNFDTAKRNGEIALDVAKKYGVSNRVFQPCNREMKLRPMESYVRSIGWTDYVSAIGIRKDETRRVNDAAGKLRLWYPLVDTWPSDKQDVLSFWEDQPFDLQIEEHEGNCLECHKKSDRKHFQLIAERPEVFDFQRMIDRECAFSGAPFYDRPPAGAAPVRPRYRGNLDTEGLFAKAALAGILPGSGRRVIPIGTDDRGDGCTESCELYEMDEAAA